VIVDSHVHVWSHDPDLYPWRPLSGLVPPSIPGSVDLLLRLMDGCGIEKATLVQPSYYGYDHSYLLDSRHRYPERLTAVCLVDPEEPSAPATLERLVREEGFQGVRLRPFLTPDCRWLSDPVGDAFWEKAAELAVSISLLISPRQTAALESMVARHPRVRVIVDHLGRQDPRESPSYRGAEALLRLSDYPNTFVKISALGYASSEPYPHDDVIALVRTIFERFGAHRLMWASDFPGVQEREGYSRALALADRYTFLSGEDRRWLLGGTALRLFSSQGAHKPR